MGGVAASISKTIASPIEVIKIRLQLQNALLDKNLIDMPYKGIYDCFKKLYIEDGLYAYYKGNFVNVIRYFPTQALNFSFKDMYKRIFNKNRKDNSHWISFFTNVVSGSAAGASTQFFVYPLDYTRTRLTNNIRLAKIGK
jgi:solute carrier family 25 (adenine nucleotide translocator) protein 4/5/6/31